MKRNGILAGGLWVIDSTKYIDRYPEPSRLATISEVVRSNGGGAFNVLVNLAKLDAAIPLSGVGVIGEDPAGDWILDQCRSHRIDTAALHRHAGLPTATTDVMTEMGSGRRTFFYQPGSNRGLNPSHFPLSTSTARILYLGYPGLLPGLDGLISDSGRSAVAELLDRARQVGFITAVDLVSADTSDWASIALALPFVDLLFVNEWEAAQLLGRSPMADDVATASSLREMGNALLERGVRRAVIVHCSRGSVCVPAGEASLRRGAVLVPAEELRGTCGAGDALAAGFLLGFHRDLSWSDCLELAVCAAATCLNDLTSSARIRPWRDCLVYGSQHGFREFL